jgi:phosphoglycerate dehydrogenase-like enzyme
MSGRRAFPVGAPVWRLGRRHEALGRLMDTSRGPIIEEAALDEALRERKIAGAAIDVFDAEPLPPDHPYRSLENMLATPHIGYVARELYSTFYRDVVKNIARLAGFEVFSTTGSFLA